MTDTAAITLVVGLAIGAPSWAAFFWFAWRFVRAAIVYRGARRAIRETQELFDRTGRNDLIVHVLRIPPEVKV